MPGQPPSPAGVTVCFTPGGNCTNLIVKTVDEAKSSILVQAYSFTSAPIAKVWLDAHKRGVLLGWGSDFLAIDRHRQPSLGGGVHQ